MKQITFVMALGTLLTGSAQAGFDFRLYEALGKKPGNLLFSPYSVSTVLSMASEGAKGKTLEEMRTVLGDQAGLEKARAEIKAADKVAIEGDQHLWSSLGKEYRASFEEALKKKFDSGITPLDFRNIPDASREKINAWVSDKTHDKIKDLLGPGTITKDTELVLTSALYFKGAWLHSFNEGATKKGKFTTGKGKAVEKEFLHQTHRFLYAENESFQAVRLPYENPAFALTIFLPKKGHKLAALKEATLHGLREKLVNQTVAFAMPKFRVETEASLEGTLENMGMPLAFSSKADFSGVRELGPEEYLYLSKVAHKAFIEVDEKGTEAAAASAAVMMVGTSFEMNPPKPKQFRADHPFAYVLEHVPTKTILFMGRVEEL